MLISQTSPSQAPYIYAATVIANFGSSDVTWNEITDSIPWQVAGIEGDWDLMTGTSIRKHPGQLKHIFLRD